MAARRPAAQPQTFARAPGPPPPGSGAAVRAQLGAGLAQAQATPRQPTMGDQMRAEGRQRAPTPAEQAQMAASGLPYVPPRRAPVAASQQTAGSILGSAPSRLGAPQPGVPAPPLTRSLGTIPTPMGSAPKMDVAFHKPAPTPSSSQMTPGSIGTGPKPVQPGPPPATPTPGATSQRAPQLGGMTVAYNTTPGRKSADTTSGLGLRNPDGSVKSGGGDPYVPFYSEGKSAAEGLVQVGGDALEWFGGLFGGGAEVGPPPPTQISTPGYVPQPFTEPPPKGYEERKKFREENPGSLTVRNDEDRAYDERKRAHAAANPPAFFPGTDYSTTAPDGGMTSHDPYRFFYEHDPAGADRARDRARTTADRGATNLETIGNEARSAGWGYANSLDAAAGGIVQRGDAGDTRLTNRANTIADTGTRVSGNVRDAAASGQRSLNNFGQYLENYGSDAVGNVNDQAGVLTGTGQRLSDIADAERKRRLTELNPELAEGTTGDAISLAKTLPELEATEGPSAALATLNLATDRNARQQLALARSGRGFGQSASALSEAADNIAGLQQDAANQAAVLRAQENAAWRGRQASNIGTAAGLGLTGAERYLSQEGARAQTELEATRARDAAAANLYGTGVQALGQGAETTVAAGRLGLDVLTEEGRLRESGANMTNQAAMAAANAEQRAAEQAAATEARAIDTGVGAAVAGAGVTAQAAQTALQGLRDQAGNFNQAAIQRMSGEELAHAITVAQAQGDQALADVLVRQYAIQAGQLQAAQAAKAQKEASLIGAAGSITTSFIGSDDKSSDIRGKKNVRNVSGYVTSDERAKIPAAPDVQTWLAQGGKRPEGLEKVIERAQKDGEEIAAQSITEWLNEGGRPPPGLVRHQGDYEENRLGARRDPKSTERFLMSIGDRRAPGTVAPGAKFPKPPKEPRSAPAETKAPPGPPPKPAARPAKLAPVGPLTRSPNRETDLRAASNSLYEYRDPGAPGSAPGTQIGPMAQDLQRTAAAPLVKRAPNGMLQVDAARAGLTALGAIGEEQRKRDEQERRLRTLERRVG